MMPIKNAPCEVCGVEKNNVMEPRFYYVVCEDHVNVPPLEISKYRKK